MGGLARHVVQFLGVRSKGSTVDARKVAGKAQAIAGEEFAKGMHGRVGLVLRSCPDVRDVDGSALVAPWIAYAVPGAAAAVVLKTTDFALLIREFLGVQDLLRP